MATYKRRIVYLSDEEWAKAQEEARRYKMSISAYFRSLIVGGRLVPEAARREFDEIAARRMPEFRPVPKPGRK